MSSGVIDAISSMLQNSDGLIQILLIKSIGEVGVPYVVPSVQEA